MKFKVGDTVKVKTNSNSCFPKKLFDGNTITISKIRNGGSPYLYGDSNNRFWWSEDELTLVKPEKDRRAIVITTDGKITKAVLKDGKDVINEATAVCGDNDEFDFTIGAKTAFERLMSGKPKSHTYKMNDKVRVIADSAFHNIPVDSVVTLHQKYQDHYWTTNEYKTLIIPERDFVPAESEVHTEKKDKVMKYKVGDKVRVRKDLKPGKIYFMEDKYYSDTFVANMLEFSGKVVEITIADKKYCINDCPYYWTDEMFEPVSNNKIVIVADGKVTLACLCDGNKVIKDAIANCSPADTFDFNTGAKIAFERLMGGTPESSEKKSDEEKGGEDKWRVVKRPSKVGDYIRLTEKRFSFDEVGDILRVDDVIESGKVSVYGRNHSRPTGLDNYMWRYFRRDYEVVEPIENDSKNKSEHHTYKVGDKVRVISNTLGHYIPRGTVVELIKKGLSDDSWVVLYKGEEFYIPEHDFVPADSNGADKNDTDKPELFNGKVVCMVDGWAGYTKGKIYEYKDGCTIDDDGDVRPKTQPYTVERVKKLEAFKDRFLIIKE